MVSSLVCEKMVEKGVLLKVLGGDRVCERG